MESRDWTVTFSNAAGKSAKKLPPLIRSLLVMLAKDLEKNGPIQKEWANFGSLAKSKSVPDSSYHCHIKKGKPTYVACWQIVNKTARKIEVFYVGTHSHASYEKH